MIYNSPYYGFQTKADLFFDLRRRHPNLVGFKEFGGADSSSYAAEQITSGDPGLSLMVGVDTQVLHGFVRAAPSGRSRASAMRSRNRSCGWSAFASKP